VKNELMIVWATDNRETSINMICLYAGNAKPKGWFDEVTLVIWGASQHLIANDAEVKGLVDGMVKNGVKVVACKSCAESLGTHKQLQSCGIEVYYTGELISDWAKSGKPMMTF